MDRTVTIEVDSEAEGQPPAEDTLRQLLEAVHGLQAASGGDVEWRIAELSMNSPVRAALEPVYRRGGDVPPPVTERLLGQVSKALEIAASGNPALAYSRSGADSQRILQGFRGLGRGRGRIALLSARGRVDVRPEQVHLALAHPKVLAKQKRPELGSIEGVIVSAKREGDKPVLTVKSAISGRSVQCVFAPGVAEELGDRHSLREIWEGRRVLVSGTLQFDGSGQLTRIDADSLRTFTSLRPSELIRRLRTSSDRITVERGSWSHHDE